MNCDNCDPDGGFCEVHNVYKSAHLVHLCQTSAKYRKAWDEGRGPRQSLPTSPHRKKQEGPGTELAKLLAKFGIKKKQGCPCRSREVMMNAWGCDKCERKIDLIVDWMEQEAQRRKLPFVRTAAKMLVKVAIKRARKHGDQT